LPSEYHLAVLCGSCSHQYRPDHVVLVLCCFFACQDTIEETNGAELVSGGTAKLKEQLKKLEKGGVLFVDEAYQLDPKMNPMGQQVSTVHSYAAMLQNLVLPRTAGAQHTCHISRGLGGMRLFAPGRICACICTLDLPVHTSQNQAHPKGCSK
jgi:hypothetical protein